MRDGQDARRFDRRSRSLLAGDDRSTADVAGGRLTPSPMLASRGAVRPRRDGGSATAGQNQNRVSRLARSGRGLDPKLRRTGRRAGGLDRPRLDDGNGRCGLGHDRLDRRSLGGRGRDDWWCRLRLRERGHDRHRFWGRHRARRGCWSRHRCWGRHRVWGGHRVWGRHGGRRGWRRRSRVGSRIGGGLRRLLDGGARGQEPEGIEVPVRLGGHADAELNIRLGDVGAGRADRTDHRALRNGGVALDRDRAEVDERDRVSVVGPDRHRQPVGGNRAGERNRAAPRCKDDFALATPDGDAAVLATLIRVGT